MWGGCHERGGQSPEKRYGQVHRQHLVLQILDPDGDRNFKASQRAGPLPCSLHSQSWVHFNTGARAELLQIFVIPPRFVSIHSVAGIDDPGDYDLLRERCYPAGSVFPADEDEPYADQQ